jgi:hypothetical protein
MKSLYRRRREAKADLIINGELPWKGGGQPPFGPVPT